METSRSDHEVSVEAFRLSLRALCDSEGGGDLAHSTADEAPEFVG